jgi:hypothetical protein
MTLTHIFYFELFLLVPEAVVLDFVLDTGDFEELLFLLCELDVLEALF